MANDEELIQLVQVFEPCDEALFLLLVEVRGQLVDDAIQFVAFCFLLGKFLEGAAEDAGVNKPVTFTNFRKSSASYLASRA